MNKAVVCVSFGTSVPAARESITAVEDALRQAAGDRLFVTALTSPTIRRILKERGEAAPSLDEALEALREQGVTEVLVQPTHILRGHEYDRLQREAEAWRDRFETLRVGKPLLADTEDLRALAAALSAAYPPRAEETLMLIGHGTDHAADMTYSALQTAFRLLGRTDVLVGTVEGWPAFDEVLAQLRQRWGSSVHLVPLLLVAGDHARNDLAGDESDSWASQIRALGLTPRPVLTGLGELPGVRAVFVRHARDSQDDLLKQ